MKRLILLNLLLSCTIFTQSTEPKKTTRKQIAGFFTGIGITTSIAAATWYICRYIRAQEYHKNEGIIKLFDIVYTGLDNATKNAIIAESYEKSAIAAGISGALTFLVGLICKNSQNENNQAFGSGLIKGSLATLTAVAGFFVPQYINADKISLEDTIKL